MKTKNRDYLVDHVLCSGYLVEPCSQGQPLFGIVMFPDFWGINVRQKKIAEKWARLGAVVLLADMYGGQKNGQTFEESGKLMEELVGDQKTYKNRMLAAYGIVANHTLVQPEKVFALGYCFGGATALSLARMPEARPLAGIASVHGILKSSQRVPTDHPMPKTLVLTGERDPMVPASDIQELQREMASCQADLTVVSFGLCTHAFTNEEASGDTRTAYNYRADQRSDAFLKTFFLENF